MDVSEYIDFSTLDKNNINEFEVGKIFGLDPKDFKDLEEYKKVIEDRIHINENYILPEDIVHNNIHWYYDKQIENTSVQQWAVMSEEISRELEINTRLTAIYFRPVGESFNVERLDWISNELLSFDIEVFIALNKLFFSLGMRLLSNMRVVYLNNLNHPQKIKKERNLGLILFGTLTAGIFKLKKLLTMIFLKLKRFISSK